MCYVDEMKVDADEHNDGPIHRAQPGSNALLLALRQIFNQMSVDSSRANNATSTNDFEKQSQMFALFVTRKSHSSTVSSLLFLASLTRVDSTFSLNGFAVDSHNSKGLYSGQDNGPRHISLDDIIEFRLHPLSDKERSMLVTIAQRDRITYDSLLHDGAKSI